MHIELALNLVWLFLAATGLACWSLTYAYARNRFGLRLLALGALLCILFPAISITDDLWAAHNQAETDILRSDDARAHSAVLLHTVAGLPVLSSELPAPLVFEAVASLGALPSRETSYSFGLFIRPPPVL